MKTFRPFLLVLLLLTFVGAAAADIIDDDPYIAISTTGFSTCSVGQYLPPCKLSTGSTFDLTPGVQNFGPFGADRKDFTVKNDTGSAWSVLTIQAFKGSNAFNLGLTYNCFLPSSLATCTITKKTTSEIDFRIVFKGGGFASGSSFDILAGPSNGTTDYWPGGTVKTYFTGHVPEPASMLLLGAGLLGVGLFRRRK